MKSHIIYAVIDPVKSTIIYIGWTTKFSPAMRLVQHLASAVQGQGEKNIYLRTMMQRDYMPTVIELQRCDTETEARRAEMEWIMKGIGIGWPLLNSQAIEYRTRKDHEAKWNNVPEETPKEMEVYLPEPAKRGSDTD